MNERAGSFVVWFTGLPCSGKTTLANLLRDEISSRGLKPRVLDGDSLRKTISSDLGFSKQDRDVHVQRAAQLAGSLMGPSAPVIVSLISPYRSAREYARNRIKPFIEVYLRCPLAVCEERDVKGLYRLARKGQLDNFTGVSDNYEEPLSAELVLDTDRLDARSCVMAVVRYLSEKDFL